MDTDAGRDLVGGYRLTADEIREPEFGGYVDGCETWYPLVRRMRAAAGVSTGSAIGSTSVGTGAGCPFVRRTLRITRGRRPSGESCSSTACTSARLSAFHAAMSVGREGAPSSPALQRGDPAPTCSDLPAGNRGSSPRDQWPTPRGRERSAARSLSSPCRSRPPDHGTRPP